MTATWPLLAAQAASRTTFRWGRIQSSGDWVLPIAVCLALLLFVYLVYRRDACELGRGWGWLLTALRAAAILALLLLYLQPQWRSERDVVRNSRVLLLVDTSLSMSMTDAQLPGSSGLTSRAEQVAASLQQTRLLDDLRQKHEVVVLAFDQEVRPLASLAKRGAAAAETGPATSADEGAGDPAAPGQAVPQETIDWQEALRPQGPETRLAQALRQVIEEARTEPVSGIVLFSDGRLNAGPGPTTAIKAATDAKIPVFAVGLGSDRLPANARVYKLEAPPRAYPSDPIAVTALVQGYRMAGQSVTVQLLYRPEGRAEQADQPAETQQVLLGEDGEAVAVRFELKLEEPGRKRLTLRLRPPADDRNPADDTRQTEIEIVDRKDRVLLFAGGPTREYRFLRTLLYRDPSVTVDVLLQTAQPGISQDADQILDEFPALREEMFRYDCVVAFDPDWNRLTDGQVDLLETWVGSQGGGLIVVAGPVYAGQAILGWVESERMKKIRDLYPVQLPRTIPLMAGAEEGHRDPWPLEFTREGLDAEYLWLADTATASQAAWASFPGVYRCYPARQTKPAATALAHFSDPREGRAGQQPVFFAEQFYGTGRVFYVGSGELWRLRGLDETYFERLYTGLVRHVSQGRLLRQSDRGTLIVGQEDCVLGTTVPLRAQLTDAQLKPLELATVPLDVLRPDGSVDTITLQLDPARPGTYAGQVTLLQEGLFRLELPVPDGDDQRLTRRIQVTSPKPERENPTRNDPLLARIAQETGGKYYPSVSEALAPESADPLIARLKDRTETVVFTTAPNPLLEETWLKWLLIALVTLLSTEWLLRRLWKLA